MSEKILLFKDLDREAAGLLESTCKIVTYPENTIIIHQGDETDAIYGLLSGKAVVMLLDADGKQMVLGVMRPGESFGEMSCLDGQARSATVMTREPSRLAVIPRSAFVQIVKQHPVILWRLVTLLVQRLRKATRKIEALAFMDVYGRVARLLSEHREELRIDNEPLTHEEIAQMVGASREMVSRVMKRLAEKGYIKKIKGHIIILKKLVYQPEEIL